MRLGIALITALTLAGGAQAKNIQTAVLAGGCFWCVESDLEGLDGVQDVVSGFSGGSKENANYKTVTKKKTGHREAVKVTFDADVLPYEELVDVFMRSIDPHDSEGSFCDRGDSYRTAIFATKEQAPVAEKVLARLGKTLKEDIYTPILPATGFYPAISYHQDFYKSEEKIITRFGLKTKAEAYKRYRKGCGRDKRVKQVWGKRASIK